MNEVTLSSTAEPARADELNRALVLGGVALYTLIKTLVSFDVGGGLRPTRPEIKILAPAGTEANILIETVMVFIADCAAVLCDICA